MVSLDLAIINQPFPVTHTIAPFKKTTHFCNNAFHLRLLLNSGQNKRSSVHTTGAALGLEKQRDFDPHSAQKKCLQTA